MRLERVFQPGAADLPGEFPRLRTEMAVVGSLLGQLASFSGDEQEEFALTRLLDDEPLTADNVQKAMRLMQVSAPWLEIKRTVLCAKPRFTKVVIGSGWSCSQP